MTHRHALIQSRRYRHVLVFVCKADWCDVEIHVNGGSIRQMTVRKRPWRNQFKKGGNYPLERRKD